MVVNSYKSRIKANPNLKIREARKVISKELGIGETTVSKTIAHYRQTKTVSSPNRTKIFKNITSKVDEFDKCAIRRKIHQFWFNRELPVLDKILSVVNEDESLANFSRTSLYRLLKSMDFMYTQRERKGAYLENNEIIVWRRKYLKSIKQYREESRSIYYLYETWVDAGDITSEVWVDETVGSSRDASLKSLSTGAVGTSGKGKQIMICHIGSDNGFVPGGLLCFESKKESQDEMNGGCFRDWLESVLPRLKDNAVIVMDNAPYHSVLKEKRPNKNWSKDDIIWWLQNKGEIIETPIVMAELIDIVDRIKPPFSTYAIYGDHNKTILRLPPYHCELNPLEMAWSVVKNHIKTNISTFKLDNIRNLLVEGTNKVTSDKWKMFIKHVIEEENKLSSIDFIIDELMAEN